MRGQIGRMAKVAGVQKVMVQDVMGDPDARAHSRALLAQALGITREGVVA